MFWLRLADKRKEKEHRQLQSVLQFTQTQQEVNDDLSLCVFNLQLA